VLVFIGYIIVIGIIKLFMPTSSKYNKSFVTFAGSLLFLICALRHVEFGPDPAGYVRSYLDLSYINLSDLWINFISGAGKDPFFYLFSKIISLFGASYQVWLAIIAALFIFSVSKLIYKYSNEAYLSFVALLSLGYLYFSLTGLRQTLALAMVLLSYSYLRERKLIPFVALVLLGTLFHASALIFLIAYPFANMKIGWKQVVGISVALVFAYFFSNQVRALVAIIGWTDTIALYATRETGLTISGFIIQLSIYLFCLYYKNGVLKADIKNLSFYNLLFLGLVFQAFTIVIAEAFRISMYFSIFSIVLIPKAIKAEKERRIRMILYVVVYLALLLYFVSSGVFSDFSFFWQ
jgi:hypothetical protein